MVSISSTLSFTRDVAYIVFSILQQSKLDRLHFPSDLEYREMKLFIKSCSSYSSSTRSSSSFIYYILLLSSSNLKLRGGVLRLFFPWIRGKLYLYKESRPSSASLALREE